MQSSNNPEPTFEDAMPRVGDLLANYLDFLQIIKQKNTQELFSKYLERVFHYKDIKDDGDNSKVKQLLNVDPNVEDKDIPYLDKDLSEYLSQSVIIKEFVRKYEDWHPTAINETALQDFKKNIVDHFFGPITNNPKWQEFLNKQNPPLDETDQLKIAKAFFFKLHSLAMPILLTKGSSQIENDRRALFTRFVKYDWTEKNALATLQESVNKSRERYFNDKFLPQVINLLEHQNIKRFDNDVRTAIKELKESIYYKAFSQEENDEKLNEMLNNLEKEIHEKKTAEKEGGPKIIGVKDKKKAIQKLNDIREEEFKAKKSALKTEHPSARSRSTSPFGRPKSPFGQLFKPKSAHSEQIPKPSTDKITKKKG